MKKILLATMLISLLVVPVRGVSPQESALLGGADFSLGDVPAQESVSDVMSPAIHAAILAMVHLEQTEFDAENNLLAWETLYNMLSMYGQLDERAEYQGETLLLPAETVQDYAAAIFPCEQPFAPAVPAQLLDRMRYLPALDSYEIVCGEDDLSEVCVQTQVNECGAVTLTGQLVYAVDETTLAEFQVRLCEQESMLGYCIDTLAIA